MITSRLSQRDLILPLRRRRRAGRRFAGGFPDHVRCRCCAHAKVDRMRRGGAIAHQHDVARGDQQVVASTWLTGQAFDADAPEQLAADERHIAADRLEVDGSIEFELGAVLGAHDDRAWFGGSAGRVARKKQQRTMGNFDDLVGLRLQVLEQQHRVVGFPDLWVVELPRTGWKVLGEGQLALALLRLSVVGAGGVTADGFGLDVRLDQRHRDQPVDPIGANTATNQPMTSLVRTPAGRRRGRPGDVVWRRKPSHESVNSCTSGSSRPSGAVP